MYKTQDINLSAYLVSKGFKVTDTKLVGRIVEFYFDNSASELEPLWKFNPNSEITLLQEFLKNKEKMLSYIKETTRY